MRQSRPDSGLGSQVKVAQTCLSCPLFARKRFQGILPYRNVRFEGRMLGFGGRMLGFWGRMLGSRQPAIPRRQRRRWPGSGPTVWGRVGQRARNLLSLSLFLHFTHKPIHTVLSTAHRARLFSRRRGITCHPATSTPSMARIWSPTCSCLLLFAGPVWG